MRNVCSRLTLLGRGLGSSCGGLACGLALLPPNIQIRIILVINRLILALLVGRVLVPVLLLLRQLLLRELVILCRRVSDSRTRGQLFKFQNESGQTLFLGGS